MAHTALATQEIGADATRNVILGSQAGDRADASHGQAMLVHMTEMAQHLQIL